ncbi:MAG: hypothetical protein KAR38_03590, partial [Calditrichia bacterium]|nr:hypothetical protein [Calditrichia bacterium]
MKNIIPAFIIMMVLSLLLITPALAQETVPGNTLEFDGVDDYIQVNSVVIPASGNFTVSVWAKAASLTSVTFEIISQNAGSGEDFYIGKVADGNIRAGDDWVDTGVPFPTDGLWHYYTIVKDSSNTHLYIDGHLKANKNSSIVNPAGSEFRIARQYGGYGEYFNGLVDEIRVWNTARTAQEIRENMHLTLTGSETGLVSYWQFNEAAGATTNDPVGGHNGTLYNMEEGDWVTSTVPAGGGSSYTQIVNTTGTFEFTGTAISMDFTEKTGTDTIVVSKLDLAPNTTPGTYSTFNSLYWIVNKFGGGTFNANLTFTPNEVITPEDETSPAALRLFKRASNSDGNWSNMMGGSTATVSNNTATFNSISAFSQFLIGRQWFVDISAGLTGVFYSSVAWGDYDNDGDLDILLTGCTFSTQISRIYRNDSGNFTDISAGLAGVSGASAAWGDYDND